MPCTEGVTISGPNERKKVVERARKRLQKAGAPGRLVSEALHVPWRRGEGGSGRGSPSGCHRLGRRKSGEHQLKRWGKWQVHGVGEAEDLVKVQDIRPAPIRQGGGRRMKARTVRVHSASP